jgi:RNA polymerase sigma-70 factor (ECF subfamily)
MPLTNVTERSDSPALSDRELADLVRLDGDEAAFRWLYRRHTPAVFQSVLRILGGNQPDAEDVVQEMWIRAVEGLERFRWESSLRTWLTGIAVNLCRGLFRRNDRHWLEVKQDLDVAVVRVSDDERIDLEAALRELPPGYRTVVVLHDLEGLTHAEIGEHLDISVNTSKSQLFRGRRMLRALLAPGDIQDART